MKYFIQTCGELIIFCISMFIVVFLFYLLFGFVDFLMQDPFNIINFISERTLKFK